jgi:hypothetical protein
MEPVALNKAVARHPPSCAFCSHPRSRRTRARYDFQAPPISSPAFLMERGLLLCMDRSAQRHVGVGLAPAANQAGLHDGPAAAAVTGIVVSRGNPLPCTMQAGGLYDQDITKLRASPTYANAIALPRSPLHGPAMAGGWRYFR